MVFVLILFPFLFGLILGFALCRFLAKDKQEISKGPTIEDNNVDSDEESKDPTESEITLDSLFDAPDDSGYGEENTDVNQYVSKGLRESKYFEYLDVNRLERYDYYQCNECEMHTHTVTPKYSSAYLIILAENEKELLFVYENENDGKATYLIRAKKWRYKSIVKGILQFFESKEVNKRQTVQRHSKYLVEKIPGVCNTAWLMHDYDNWVWWLQQNVKKMQGPKKTFDL